MSDFLSQDDIDALLQAGSGGGFDAVDDGTTDAFDDIVNDFMDQQTSVLGTLLGKSVTLSVDEVITSGGDLSDRLGGAYLTAQLSLDGGVSGDLFVSAQKNHFAILADLMVMGDGTAAYNAEEHDDAVKELFSAVNGGYSTFLGGPDKVSVSVSSTGVEVLADTGINSVDGKAAFVSVAVEGIDPFAIIIHYSSGLFHELNSAYGGDEDSSAGGGDGGGFDFSGEGLLSQDEMDSLTSAADDMYSESSFGGAAPAAPVANSFSAAAPKTNIDMLLDIDLDIAIELGRTDISIKRILELAPGSLVELDSFAGEPVNLLVNNKVVAKGEVVVVDENFGVRIISLVSPEERIKSLR